MNDGAFKGVKVLDLGQIYNGPYCGLMLGLLGADVIKVEPTGGERLRFRSQDDVETHEFFMLNSNKRSMIVDLKLAQGRDLFLALVDEVDVVIENFAPNTMERLGLDPQDLLRRNERLIYASGKGYGSTGPYAAMAAMDITVQAMSGVVASTGFADGPPVKAGPAFVDFMGGIHLFGGIASALYQRERTGKGQLVEVSMHDTVYPTLASSLGAIFNDPGARIPERTGNRHSGLAVAPYNIYRANDGWLAIISVSERHFEAIMRVIGREDLIADQRFSDRFARVRNMDALDAAIEAWSTGLERWAAAELLSAAGVPCAPVLTVHEVSEDRHLVERGMVQYVPHPNGGTVPVPASAIRMSDSPVGGLRAAPALGRDTDDVLFELLGLDDAERATLRASGAIK